VDASGNGRLITTVNSANLSLGQLSGTGGVVLFYTANNERMRIDASGNVGIGTSAPTSLLDVNGNAEIAGTLFLGASNHGNLGSDATQLFVRGNNVVFQNAAGSSTYVYVNSTGSVGIGTSSPDASALLDVSSTTKGFLPPRMSTAQRDAIGGATQEGLIIYNVTTDKLQVFAAGAWVNLH
jgi:hypothetical protein